MTGLTTISIYPVGLLAAWKHRRMPGALRRELELMVGLVRSRQWRTLRQSLNGYLAEINYPPAELAHLKCGHGWTKARAAARLGRYLARDNPDR